MIQRILLPKIEQALTFFPAVGIIGPRQVGQRKETLKVSGLVNFLKEELPKL